MNHFDHRPYQRLPPISTLPEGAPSWITIELIDRTIKVWQPYYASTLSPEDAVTMILSVARLYDVLAGGREP